MLTRCLMNFWEKMKYLWETGKFIIIPVILCQTQEKILGELVESEFLARTSQTINLDGGLHCGIDQELLEPRVRLHGFGHLFLPREEDKYQQNI